jgi:potassium efflux system protein
MKHRHRFIWAVLVLAALAAGLSALAPVDLRAQLPGTSTAKTETPLPKEEPRGPRPIPASQISIKAEETSEVLRSLRDRPNPDPVITEIGEALPALMGTLQDLLEETEARLRGTVSARILEDLQRRWHRHSQKITGWVSAVNGRAQSLDRDLETLQELRLTWEATRDGGAEEGLQETLLEIVNTSIELIRELEKKFGERRSELLTVQGQVDKAANVILDALEDINVARDRTRLKLTTLDSRPLWEVIANPPPRVQHWDHIVTAWEESTSDLRDFSRSYRDALIVHGLGFLLLSMILYLTKRRARATDLDGPEFKASARVISRPFSTALTLWLLGTLLLFPDAPRIVDELATLILFVPLFRILPARAVKKIPGLLAALVLINIFGRFVDLLAYLSPLYRLALLLESIVCLTLIAFSLRRTRSVPGEPPSGWRKLVRFFQIVSIFYLIAAIITNIVGNVSFAGTVTRAVFLSAYLGLVLYGVYFILKGLIHLALRTRLLRGIKMVRRHQELIHERLLTILRIGLFISWMINTLMMMQSYDPARELVTKVLTAQAKFGSVGLSLGGILGFAFTVWASFLISRVIRFVLEEDVYPRFRMPRGVPTAISIGAHYSVLLLGFFLAIAATGADLGKTTILAGAFGVGIGFGLQNIVNNFISGLILIVERPILVGDSVQIDTLFGEVKRIGLRSSTVRTWEGAEVIVPNGNLISTQVINWTLSDRQRRLDVHVGVEYGNDPEEVVRILVATAANFEGLMERPEPTTLFLGFGDFTLNFQLRAWTSQTNFLKQKSELTMAVNKALNDANIKIPIPQRDLRVTIAKPGSESDGLERTQPDES